MQPPLEPYDSGWAQARRRSPISWETSGDPHEQPALSLHGGPGGVLGIGYDVSGPAVFVYPISKSWPGGELILVDERHGGDQISEPTADAIARLAARP